MAILNSRGPWNAKKGHESVKLAIKVPVVTIRLLIEAERVTLKAVRVPIEDAVEAIKLCRGRYSARRS